MDDRSHRAIPSVAPSDRQAIVLLGVLYAVFAALAGVWIALFVTFG